MSAQNKTIPGPDQVPQLKPGTPDPVTKPAKNATLSTPVNLFDQLNLDSKGKSEATANSRA